MKVRALSELRRKDLKKLKRKDLIDLARGTARADPAASDGLSADGVVATADPTVIIATKKGKKLRRNQAFGFAPKDGMKALGLGRKVRKRFGFR